LFKEAGAASMSKMQKRRSVIVAFLAVQFGIWPVPCQAWAAQTGIEAGRASVDLELGSSTTLNIERPFGLVLIGDPRVIDFQSQGERSLRLRALGVGSTSLVIVDKKGIVIMNLAIVVQNAGAI
jgi:Flp pilus assembly secretin CpaC